MNLKKLPTPASMVLWLLCTMALVSCKKPPELPAAKVNPDFEMDPPIPSGVWVQQLEKPTDQGNFLITAQFDTAEIKSHLLAVMLSDSLTLTMHDDGLNNDDKKGDGLYSLVVQQDAAELKQELQTFSKQLMEQEKIYRYENRGVVELNREELFKKFAFQDLPDLRRRLPIEILDIPLITPEQVTSIRSHSLFFNASAVTNDPERAPNPCVASPTGAVGPWSLGGLLTELANEPVTGITPVDFTLSWFALWQSQALVNNDLLTVRSIEQAIGTWHFFSGGADQPLNMAKLPFRLRAIVNRLDLRGNSGYGFSNAGEARFVFTAIDNDCNGVPFNVILEYGVNKKTCAEVVAYAQQWMDLQAETVGSPAYNAKLQAITDQVTRAGTNPDKPNGSSLNQLRTNEIALGSLWELREFVLNATTHKLEIHTVAQTPAEIYNALNNFTTPLPSNADIARMVKFVNDNAVAVEANNYQVPETWQSVPFLGGKSHALADADYHWNGSVNSTDVSQYILSDEARHIFSLNTCAGCHRGEVSTNFTHVSHLTGALSPFLTGLGADANTTDDDNDPAGFFYVSDVAGRPTGSPTVRGFNDLDRRARDLFNLTNGGCTSRFRLTRFVRQLRFVPVRMTH